MGDQSAEDPKLINDPKNVVREMLEGLVAEHDHLSLLDGFDKDIKVVIDNTHKADEKVAIISGGGSGHEPAQAGFVGSGMLSGAVCGDVFASPTTEAVLAAIRALTRKGTGEEIKGCFLVWLNYTGDRINFGLAQEMARDEGYKVEILAVDDDIGVVSSGLAGSRGIAGQAFVLKVAGDVAATGAPLAAVKHAAVQALKHLATMGAALTSCSLPGQPPKEKLPLGVMELGLGIHGERGAEQCPKQSADELVSTLLQRILLSSKLTPVISSTKHIALLINNLGSSTGMEMKIVVRAALKQLREKGYIVARLAEGHLTTSLNMAGISLSIMAVDDEKLAHLDAPCSAPAWPKLSVMPISGKPFVPLPATPPIEIAPGIREVNADFVKRVVRACAEAAVAAEPTLTEQDLKVGDGDCGETIKHGALEIISAIDAGNLDFVRPATACAHLANAIGQAVGGTSGALYAIFFRAAGRAFWAKGNAEGAATAAHYAEALRLGTEKLQEHGRAQEGDRSMMDALIPAAKAGVAAAKGGASAAAVAAAVARAARDGAQKTKEMKPKAGRSSYLSTEAVMGILDPGAYAVEVWLGHVQSEF